MLYREENHGYKNATRRVAGKKIKGRGGKNQKRLKNIHPCKFVSIFFAELLVISCMITRKSQISLKKGSILTPPEWHTFLKFRSCHTGLPLSLIIWSVLAKFCLIFCLLSQFERLESAEIVCTHWALPLWDATPSWA